MSAFPRDRSARAGALGSTLVRSPVRLLGLWDASQPTWPTPVRGRRRGRMSREADAAWLASCSFGALLVLSVGLTDGGYYLGTSTALTIALAAAGGLAALSLPHQHLSRLALGALSTLVALTTWTALSSLWASDQALVGFEVRRGVLYTAALLATLLVASGGRGRALSTGVLAGLTALCVASIVIRADSGAVVDRYYGTLLEEPVGYPNALGVLAALGVVLVVGLGVGWPGRSVRGLGTFLVLILGLSGSRGGALALVLGLLALVWLLPGPTRWPALWNTSAALALGVPGWLLISEIAPGGVGLGVAALAVTCAGALVPPVPHVSGRALWAVFGAAAAALTVAVVAVAPVATGSSFRSDYWSVALEGLQGNPALGTGAGSFHLTWRELAPQSPPVRDAHSLYVESLGELGPVGLVLVLVLVALPVVAALRARRDPTAAAAGAGFLVVAAHAAVDWDWEMPVVMLAALACAAVALQRRLPGRGDRARERRHDA